MHRALAIPEIFQAIIWDLLSIERGDWLHPLGGSPSTIDKREVRSLALTCRLFCGPALDAVWACVTEPAGLQRLFAIIPIFEQKTGLISGQLSDSDLERYCEYSRRIRSLYLDSSRSGVTSSAILRILHALPKRALLPNLQNLSICLPSQRDEYIFFLHPGLVNLTLRRSYPPGGGTFVSSVVLHSLHSSTPHLRTLIVEANVTFETFAAALDIPGLRCMHWTHTNGDNAMVIRGNVFEQMRSRDTLQQFLLKGHVRYSGQDPKQTSRCSMPALQHLDIGFEVQDLSVVNSIIFAPTDFPALEDVAFFAANKQRVEGNLKIPWQMLLRTLRKSFPRNMCSFQLLYDPQYDPSTLGLPFTPFVEWLPDEVRLLRLEGPFFAPLLHSDVKKLLDSHPKLDNLSILTTEQSPLLTFRVLVDIMLAAPQLRDLRIEVEFEDLPSISDIPITNHGLKSLCFDAAPPEDHCRTTRLIDRLFPNLKEVGGMDEDDDWEEIQDFVQGLREAREDERRRMAAITR